jgi:hypothetical protein
MLGIARNALAQVEIDLRTAVALLTRRRAATARAALDVVIDLGVAEAEGRGAHRDRIELRARRKALADLAHLIAAENRQSRQAPIPCRLRSPARAYSTPAPVGSAEDWVALYRKLVVDDAVAESPISG